MHEVLHHPSAHCECGSIAVLIYHDYVLLHHDWATVVKLCVAIIARLARLAVQAMNTSADAALPHARVTR